MGSITINFANATLSSSTSSIIVTGGTFELTANDALSISGTVSFDSLFVTTGAISINVDAGTSFTAMVQAVVGVASGGEPSIEVTNFAGTVMVTWPTAMGLQTQMLESGNPLTLSGYTG